MAFIEPCFGIGHNLSLICQMTSEDIKHQLIIIRAYIPIAILSPPGFQARSKDQEILEEGGGAGPSLLPRRDHEYGGGAGLSKLDVFCFELSKLFVNSGATDIVLVTLSSTAVERAIAQCTSRWAMARGHRLNTSIVLAAVHGLSGLFRAVSAVEPITLAPFPLCPRP